MEDMNKKAKEAVLKQIMDLMDERELGGLKSKSPKFAKVEIETEDPMMAEKLKNRLLGTEEDSEMPTEETEEPTQEVEHSEEHSEDGMDDEDLRRLKEMYSSLK